MKTSRNKILVLVSRLPNETLENDFRHFYNIPEVTLPEDRLGTKEGQNVRKPRNYPSKATTASWNKGNRRKAQEGIFKTFLARVENATSKRSLLRLEEEIEALRPPRVVLMSSYEAQGLPLHAVAKMMALEYEELPAVKINQDQAGRLLEALRKKGS